jgi:competence protein ComEA
VDVNSANAHTLEGLPGIGPSKAEAIEKWREEHGRYDKLADLDAVPGIGPSTLEGLAGQVCFGGAPNSEQKGNKK